MIRGKGNYLGLQEEFIGQINLENNEGYLNCSSELIISTEDIVHNKSNRFLKLEEEDFANLSNGDIIHLKPNGIFEILFKSNKFDNSLFITNQCNFNCIFCPQPPINTNDFEYHFEINKKLIELIPQSTEIIGITGGEPLFAGKYLFRTMELINEYLPDTTIQMLTNGYLLGNNEYFQKIKSYLSPKYFIAIPLYSDFPNDHDKLVKKKGAFNNTLKGLYNLAENNVSVEIRIVLNTLTISRLEKLSNFIFKNLPFVDHVAFMGLEIIGNAHKNFIDIWNKDDDFIEKLKESIHFLDRWGINTSIYNIPLCVLDDELRPFSAKSISYWKENYSKECLACVQKDNCCGLFNTSTKKIYNINSLQ